MKNCESYLSKLNKQSEPVGITSRKHDNLIKDSKNLAESHKKFYENLKSSHIN
jgi:hypothetical protein